VKRLSLRLGSRRGHLAEGFPSARSFEALILPHLDSAYNLARFLTRDAALSDDVVQEAMLRAFRAFGEFRGDSARAWLLAIVRNCCHSAMTARGVAAVRLVQEDPEAADAHPDPTDDPEQALMRASDAAAVRSLVEALPEPFREALVLRELEELSYRDIAEATGVAMGTVMSRIARGRSLLADRLIAGGGDLKDARSSA
jgi:RNA polymerase sigma factor (sigma-70 family)